MAIIDIESLANDICKLNLVEAAELTKILEEKIGLPIGSFAVANNESADKGDANKDVVEQTEFSVFLEDEFDAAKKINIIRVFRSFVPDLGLKEAKEFVEAKGSKELVKDKKYKKEEAEEIKKKFEEVGAKITIK